MSREQIIRMAREAGWSGIYTQWREPDGSPDWTPVKESLTVPVTMEQIERFAALAFAAGAAAEREASARLCDQMFHDWCNQEFEDEDEAYRNKPDAEDCKKAIRARGNT